MERATKEIYIETAEKLYELVQGAMVVWLGVWYEWGNAGLPCVAGFIAWCVCSPLLRDDYEIDINGNDIKHDHLPAFIMVFCVRSTIMVMGDGVFRSHLNMHSPLFRCIVDVELSTNPPNKQSTTQHFIYFLAQPYLPLATSRVSNPQFKTNRPPPSQANSTVQ